MLNIVTLAYNRPDFIELQLNSLKKWIKEPFTYTVYDNCPDDAVKDECDRLGIHCKPIKIFSADASWCVGLSLDKMWETLQHTKGKLWYIDSDMFLIGELPTFETQMAFVPQVRGEYHYPWTGLMYFDMKTLPHKNEMKWHVDYALKDTDVGGLNHHYIEEYDPTITELEMWTLIDEDKYSFNGIDSDYGGQHHTNMKILAEQYDFPKPYSFDEFRIKGEKPFVFHFKSASGYPAFMTPEYVRLKTLALRKLLGSMI